MSQRKDTGLNTNLWPKLVDHYKLCNTAELSYYILQMSNVLLKNNLIYFIQGVKTLNIKIGRTRQILEDRMAVLQCGSPDQLIFLGGILGESKIETAIHHKFSKLRLHGEWFKPSEELLKYINTNTLKAENALYHIDEDLFNGKLTFTNALNIGDTQLLAEHKKKWENIFQQMNDIQASEN